MSTQTHAQAPLNPLMLTSAFVEVFYVRERSLLWSAREWKSVVVLLARDVVSFTWSIKVRSDLKGLRTGIITWNVS